VVLLPGAVVCDSPPVVVDKGPQPASAINSISSNMTNRNKRIVRYGHLPFDRPARTFIRLHVITTGLPGQAPPVTAAKLFRLVNLAFEE
jgi:hypothetical protein